MGKYDAFAAMALRLIARHGGPITLTRVSPGTLNPVTQARTGATTATHTFQAVANAPAQAHRFGVDLEGKHAKELYIALKDATVQPQPGDAVILGGESWRIFWAQAIDPALDGPILSIAYAERGA